MYNMKKKEKKEEKKKHTELLSNQITTHLKSPRKPFYKGVSKVFLFYRSSTGRILNRAKVGASNLSWILQSCRD